MLLIGRTIPRPVAIESFAGALTGEEPIKVPADQWWYPPVERAIRMADGTGILVERCDQHPDPVGEHVRFQICEGEMLQALGRARAINRTAESPLAIGIVADVVLPITVNKVEVWQAPSRAMEPAEEGAMLFSPKDMVEIWPWVWKTVDAAKKTLGKIRASAQRAGTRCQNGIYDSYIPFRHSVAVLYQRPGPKQKLQRAVFDLDKWPSPRAWFDEKRKAIIALLQSWEPGDIPPLAGTSKLAIIDHLVRVLRKARYTLSADVKQHKEYVGTGRSGRFTLSKDPQAMTAYDGAPGGAPTPHVDAHSALSLELRTRALDLHEAANDKSQ
jgi:hypothetical protein